MFSLRNRCRSVLSRVSAIAGLLALAISCVGCHMNSQGLNTEGVRLHQQGQFTPAIQKFSAALAANPRDPDAYYNLAATYHEMARLQPNQQTQQYAEEYYHRCLDIDPNHSECRRNLAVLLAQTGRSDKAQTMLENWVTTSPTAANARLRLAQYHEEIGNPDKAVTHIQEAIAIDNSNELAWKALGKHYELNGDLNRAISAYNKSFELNHFQKDVQTRIATLQRDIQGTPATTGQNTRWATTPGGSPR